MDQLLNEIESAIDNELYLVALQTTLALPDICAAMQSDDGVRTKARYIDWYNEYIKPNADIRMKAEDCYYFRCSMLHEGTTVPKPKGKEEASYKRIYFASPYDERYTIHNTVFNDVLFIDVYLFCHTIIECVRRWKQKMEEEKNECFLINAAKTIRYYPQGVKPYIVGVGVIG